MKKLFIAVLAVAALASCAQDEIISKNQTAIAFGDAFVDNATKAIYDNNTNKVTAFQVWGTVTGEGNTVALYEGANVYDGAAYNTAWTCDVTRYWTENCKYAFYAVVDSTVTPKVGELANPNVIANTNKGVVESIKYVADGENDLLYGYKEENTDDTIPALVKFEMQHLLSRIQFTFENGVTLAAGDKGEYSFKVTSLSVKTWKEGIYTVGEDTPWAQVGSTLTPIDFAATAISPYVTGTASEGKVIIPGKQDLLISYTYEVYFDNNTEDETAATKIYTDTVTDTKLTHDFDVNHSYNIVARLELDNQIKFTIESVKWENDTPTTIQ